jgi:divalent metal cation (Fe/Co/Zn/Cd) transporter
VKDWLDDKNILNLIIFVTKVATSIQSVSMVVIALTLDSRLDLLSGFIKVFKSVSRVESTRYRLGD